MPYITEHWIALICLLTGDVFSQAGRFVCIFTVQLILLVLLNLAQFVIINFIHGFIAFSNYLRVHIFAILLSKTHSQKWQKLILA